MYKLIRLFEKLFKPKYITLKRCKEFNCDYNHAEVCFLREDVPQILFCDKLKTSEKEVTND